MDVGTIKEALMLKPGTYRISELSDKLNKSRKTIERYVDKLRLKTTEIEHNNKLVTGVILTVEDADKVQTYIESLSGQGTVPRTVHTDTPDITLVNLLTQERDSLKLQLQQALEHNKQLEARMGETIEALKTSLAVLKRDNEKMEAKLNPTIDLIPVTSRETLWQKIVKILEKPYL